MATQMSKSQLIEKIATTTEVSKREVKSVMETLVDVGHKELKKNGVFLVPGFAKFVVVKKPATKARKWGRIINVLNTFAKAPAASSAPTSVSRAAGMALTKVMANEGGEHNILVNAMLVGLIMSDQWVKLHAAKAPNTDFEAFARDLAKGVPLGRIGTAEEFANLACFLASEQGSYITGTAINVDGGRSPVV